MKLTIKDIQDLCEIVKNFTPGRTSIMNVLAKHFPHIKRPGKGHGLVTVTERQAAGIVDRLKYKIKKRKINKKSE